MRAVFSRPRVGPVALLVAVLSCASTAGSPPAPPIPTSAEELYAEGVRRRGEGRRREAAALWEAGLREDPDHVDTQVALAGTLITLRDHERARVLLDAAAGARPSDPQVWLERGRLDLAQHSYEDAIDDFGRALELAPALYSAQIGRVEALASLGRCDEARAELQALRQRRRLWVSPRADRLVRNCQEPVNE